MGSFPGHVVPGIIYIVISMWWIISILRKYYQSLQKNGRPFQNSASHKMFCCKNKRLKNQEIEGYIKVGFCTLHASAEIYQCFFFVSTQKDRSGFYHHILILFFFILNGMMDLLVHHGYHLVTKLRLNYITLALAFLMQGFLLSVHNQESPGLEMINHRIFIYLAVLSSIAIILEMVCITNLFIGLMKSFLVLMIGVWFITFAFIFYSPGAIHSPDPNDPVLIMLSPVLLAFELLVVIIFILVIAGLMGLYFKKKNVGNEDNLEYQELKYTDEPYLSNEDSLEIEQAKCGPINTFFVPPKERMSPAVL